MFFSRGYTSLALYDIETPGPHTMLDQLHQRHAVLLGQAARGDVLRVDQRDEPVQVKSVERVAAGLYSLRRDSLSQQIAAHMPSDPGFCDALSLLDEKPAFVYDFLASFERECPQPEPVLGIAAQAHFHPLLGPASLKHRPEAHGERIGEDHV